MRQLIVVTFLVLSADIAHADQCPATADQRTMDECAGAALLRSDAELNRLYGQIVRRLAADPAAARLLTSAQRAWVAFRDAECVFATSGVSGGSIYPMLRAQCAEAMTRARVDQFKTYLHCQEGDLTCPVPTK